MLHSPTAEPSFHPTLHGDPFVLRGTIFYDSNGNHKRDSNVEMKDLGTDVEYRYGLGGVAVQLMECDPESNKALVNGEDIVYEEGTNNYVTTVSQGYNVLMQPKLARNEEGGGK